jgi:hypothetical protein
MYEACDGAGFCGRLMKAAEPELKPIHAIVLPETALRLDFANQVAIILAKKGNLDFFLTGVLADADSDARNLAAIYRFANGRLVAVYAKERKWLRNSS